MILKRKDNTFVIDGEYGPYHVIKSDPLYQEVLDRIASGEPWQWDIPPSPGIGYEWNQDTWEWIPGLSVIKNKQKQSIKEAFEKEKQSGHTYSYVINAEINAREKDMTTLTGLVEHMENKSKTETLFRVYNNGFITATLQQVRDIRSETIEYGMQVHEKKWSLESSIDSAQTKSEVEAVQW